MRLTKLQLSLFTSFLLLTLPVLAVNKPKCRPLFDELSTTFKSINLVDDQHEVLTNPKYSTQAIESFASAYDKAHWARWSSERGQHHFLRLRSLASQLAQTYEKLAPVEVERMQNSLKEFGTIVGRGKSADSILAKLIRKDFRSFEMGQAGIIDIKSARVAIGDGIGTRLTLKNDSSGKIDPRLIQKFVDQVVKDIKEGTRVTEIMNYRAAGNRGIPYLSDEQVSQIRRADADYRMSLKKLKDQGHQVAIPEPILIKSGPNATFESGYSAFHMNIVYSNGISAEVQMRGKKMSEAAEIQHVFYDLNAGKILSPAHMENPYIAKVANDYSNLSKYEKSIVMSYVEQELIYARQIESGIKDAIPPIFPMNLPENFKFQNLRPHIIGP